MPRIWGAAYIGVGTLLWDDMVKDGRMPGPKRINARKIWDRRQVDEAFSALPDTAEANPWDED